MRSCRRVVVVAVVLGLVLAAGAADAQSIHEGFDSYPTGSPPPWFWWHWGPSGTRNVDETIFRGASGKSVKFSRTVFDGNAFAIGQSFWPTDGVLELTYYFYVESADQEMLSSFGRHDASNQIAWWVTVGGAVGNAIGTYSDSRGWTHVMDVAPGTWYGVYIAADMASSTFDITVWEDQYPANTATVTGLDFRNGAAASVIDQIQFGDFNAGTTPHSDSSYLDDVVFIGPTVFRSDFETGNTGGWAATVP